VCVRTQCVWTLCAFPCGHVCVCDPHMRVRACGCRWVLIVHFFLRLNGALGCPPGWLTFIALLPPWAVIISCSWQWPSLVEHWLHQALFPISFVVVLCSSFLVPRQPLSNGRNPLLVSGTAAMGAWVSAKTKCITTMVRRSAPTGMNQAYWS